MSAHVSPHEIPPQYLCPTLHEGERNEVLLYEKTVKLFYYFYYLKDIMDRRSWFDFRRRSYTVAAATAKFTQLRNEYEQSLKDFRRDRRQFFRNFNKKTDIDKLAQARALRNSQNPVLVKSKELTRAIEKLKKEEQGPKPDFLAWCREELDKEEDSSTDKDTGSWDTGSWTDEDTGIYDH